MVLTNTNNQNICRNSFSTFKNNLLHLEEERSQVEVKLIPLCDYRCISLNLIKQTGRMCIFPLYLAVCITSDLCHIIIHVEFHIFLWQHLQEQQFKLYVTELNSKVMWGHNAGLCLSPSLLLPSWWFCQFQDPVCSGTAAHCCQSQWWWRLCLSNKMQFPCLKNMLM